MDTVLTRTILLIICFGCFLEVSGQQGVTFDLKKPKKYENKKLASEKTDEKKFRLPRHFIQNTVTKFNWNFNANSKLDQVIARAKAVHRDDFTKLLSFYNYSLDQTAQQGTELDSVIDKANTGILIHDLRNDWIDNLYMLMGKAYYFKKLYDTAYITFQYVNFAFAPKEKDGYNIPIGSNANEGNASSVATNENKRSFAKKWLGRPPSRNEALIWLVRTYIAQDQMPEAAGLIQTLKHDPQFPARLGGPLNEMQALWFYQQEMHDSAAVYLEAALDDAGTKQERARWEYLIGQLYERAGKPAQSQDFFGRAIRHTLDPVMDVHARLNIIRENKGDDKIVQQNIAELLKMARRDRYIAYRDVIYTAAAQMELERNNPEAAKALFQKAALYINPESDPSQRTRTFLQLAELSYQQKQYADAKRFYDSINLNDKYITDPQKIQRRKVALDGIVAQSAVIYRQDSLQRIAGMPDKEREAFLKKLAQQLRRQRGLREEEPGPGGNKNVRPQGNNADLQSDLFSDNSGQGEWYFYNPSAKARGFTEFKGKWGNRPNVDNWQRAAAVARAAASKQQPGQAPPVSAADSAAGRVPGNLAAAGANDVSYQALLSRLPITPAQLKASNDSIEIAMYQLGKAYVNGLEDCASAITTFESLLNKFPQSPHRPEILFHLYYCYQKTGDVAKANQAKQELQEKYHDTPFEKIVSHPGASKADSAKSDMTRRYESIYNLFIEGRFDEALAEKKTADSIYNNNYWTPQLLYIQSIYHVRQHQDDSARRVLQQIVNLFPTSPLAEKAKTMMSVLSRRKEIEDHLTKLQIERPTEDSVIIIDSGVTAKRIVQAPPAQQPPVVAPSDREPPPARAKPPMVTPAVKPQQQARPDSATRKPLTFAFYAGAPHYVAVVLNKVDQVYVNETKNAFNRYNKENFYNKTIDITTVALDDSIKLVLMNNFENAAAATAYLSKAARAAATDIIPWLPAAKYAFIIISPDNLDVLQNTKDLAGYRKLLSSWVPGVKW